MFEDRYNRAQFAINPGAPVVFNLNPGLKMISGKVIVDATVTIAGVTAAGTPIGDGGVTNLVQKILVLANKAAGSRYPNGALVDCRPQTLLRFAMPSRNGKYVAEMSGNVLGNGANGVYNIYFEIPIQFGLSKGLGNYMTALNLDPVDSQGNPIYSAVQVRVDFATVITQLFSGNNATGFAIAGTCQWRDDRLALTDGSGNPLDTIPVRQEDHVLYIQNANDRLVDAAMPNDGAFTQWMILAQQGEPALALSDALINRIEAEGTQLNFKEYWPDSRMEMIDRGLFDASQTLTGILFYDWTHGTLANANPAAGLQHRIAVNNPSGAGNDRLLIYTRRVYGLK